MQAVLVRLLQDVVQRRSPLDQTRWRGWSRPTSDWWWPRCPARPRPTRPPGLGEVERSSVLDALTRLPNRTALLDRGRQAIANARRHGSRVAVLFVDLDDFKAINDNHGHAFGDQVLRMTAERMLSVVREVDTVSRHGGDEFVVLLAELSQPADAQAVAGKLVGGNRRAGGAGWAIGRCQRRAWASPSIPRMGTMSRPCSHGPMPPCTRPSASVPAVSRYGLPLRPTPRNTTPARSCRRGTRPRDDARHRRVNRQTRICATPTRSWCWPP